MTTNNAPSNRNFNVGKAVTTPLRLPSGLGFLARVLLWASALLLVIYAVLGQDVLLAYGEFLVVSAENRAKSPNPETSVEDLKRSFAMFSGLGLEMLLLVLAYWFVMVSAETAFHKNVFRGEDLGAFPLRFGKDEIRVMIAQICVFFALLGLYLAGIIGLIIVSVIAAVFATIAKPLGVVAVLLMIAGVGYWLFKLVQVSIRLAPTAAMTVRDNRSYNFEGWSIVKGRSWPVFGAYVLVYLTGYILVSIILGSSLYVTFGTGDVWSFFMGYPVEEPRAILSIAGEALESGRVKLLAALSLALYLFATLLLQGFIWGVGNYAAQTEERQPL